MYKAINQAIEQDVIILNVEREEEVNQLRGLDRQDQLLCPGCRQPVRVRAGEQRAWHFAHKHLANCHYGEASPEVLKTRAVLYRWLKQKFGEQATIEKSLPVDLLPREVDGWVERPDQKPLAYWIIDAAIKPEARSRLKYAFRQVNAQVTWVFVWSMMRLEATQTDELHLTTTEREFADRSEYNDPYWPSQDEARRNHYHLGGLHYLDPEREILTTYRSLVLVHAPQLYRSARKYESPMAEVLVLGSTGEFVHPGEVEALKAYHIRQKQLEEERKARETKEKEVCQMRLAQLKQQLARQPQQSLAPTPHPKPRLEPPPKKEEAKPVPPPQPVFTQSPQTIYSSRQSLPTCIFCGARTSNYWYHDGKDNTCRCRPCRDKGLFKPGDQSRLDKPQDDQVE